MKSSLIKLLTIVLVSSMLFATTRPSIEGRASVAEQGDLPPGMYIKAHTFLPGDTVIITNPSTKVSVEVFVFETIDEGVAAIVSQEVAEKLFITNNSDTMVQIRKVIASAEIAEAESVFDRDESVETENASDEVFVDDSELYVEENIEENIVTLFDEPEVVLEDTTYEDVLISEEILTSNEVDSEEVFIEEFTDVIVSAEVIDEPIEDFSEETLVFTPFSDMTSLFEAPVESEEELVDEVVITEHPVVEEIFEEEIIDVVVANEEEIFEEEILETAELSIFEEPVIEEPIIEEPIIDDVEVVEAVIEEKTIETPNILIPTEENPPLYAGIEDEPEVTFNSDYILNTPEEVVEDAVETETVDIFALTPATEYVEKVPAFSGNMNNYIVDSISIDGSRKFYVQLATYRDSENINSVLASYSEKYPMALVRSPVVNNAYQVVVGPLTKDEYTVVLERFKSYGYKDAFLRIAE